MAKGVKQRVTRTLKPRTSAPKSGAARTTRWAWRQGVVDVREEHFELRYGSAESSDWDSWVLVARVGRPTRRTFRVQFTADPENPSHAQMIEAAIRELDFYFVELGEKDPWGYARYHCSTGANIYSTIHWSLYRSKRGAKPAVESCD